MYINCNTIITVGAVIGALSAIIAVFCTVHKWYLRQQQQDVEIKAIQEEQCLLTYGILACLDGLEQLGCNHTVPATRSKIEKHLNEKAHSIGGDKK
jgi:hypothetical protein